MILKTHEMFTKKVSWFSRAKCLQFMLLIFCVSCSLPSLSPASPRIVYTLQTLPLASPLSCDSSFNDSILVKEGSARGILQGRKIIFKTSPQSFGSYAFAEWEDPPLKLLSRLLIEKMQQSGAFPKVVALGSAVHADVQININLLEYCHDAQASPGEASSVFSVDLISVPTAGLIAQRKFSARLKLEDYSAEGAVGAFQILTNSMLDQVIVWLSQDLCGFKGETN